MREVRDRQYETAGDLDRLWPVELDGGSGCLLQTFTETTYPTSAQKVYACHPCYSDAAESEGSSIAITADTTVTVYAANLGSSIPASGTNVVGIGVGGRWVFRYDG